MCAISVDDRTVMEDWTQRGIDLGEREPDASYWAGPLLNNLGWAYFDDANYDRTPQLFERALDARNRDPGNVEGIAWGAVRRRPNAANARPRPRRSAAARGGVSAVPTAAELEVELAACRAAA
jgi:hypothetical protein